MTIKSNFIIALVVIFFCSAAVPVEAATAAQLKAQYQAGTKKINILIVPGHDDEYWGTEFGDVRESDIVVSIGQYLYDYLKQDPKFNVQITRTQMGYTSIFKNYFENNRTAILDFISTSRQAHQAKLATGAIKATESVPHNTANSEVALRLYGINKWANENNIDITLHLHVNDQGGRVWGQVGDYTGVAIYIPENQFSNAAASAIVGESIFNELMKKNHKSTYPAESRGLIEDQDLIAVGASDTVKNAAALIEYGYIYEPQYKNVEKRDVVTKDLAYQTSVGIKSFFGVTPPASSSLTKNLSIGSKGSEVSALQNLLTKEKVYTCGVTGTFGPCTEKGVKAFQKKYKIDQTGTVGPLTRKKLNSF